METVRCLAEGPTVLQSSGPETDVFEDDMLHFVLENRLLDLHGAHELDTVGGRDFSCVATWIHNNLELLRQKGEADGVQQDTLFESVGDFESGGWVANSFSLIEGRSSESRVLDARRWSGGYWGLWRFYRDRDFLALQILRQIPRTIKLGVHAAVSWIETFVTGGDTVCREGPWADGLLMGGEKARERMRREILKELALQLSTLPISDRLSEDNAHNSFSLVKEDVRFLVDLGSNCSTVKDLDLLIDVRPAAALVAKNSGSRNTRSGNLAGTCQGEWFRGDLLSQVSVL